MCIFFAVSMHVNVHTAYTVCYKVQDHNSSLKETCTCKYSPLCEFHCLIVCDNCIVGTPHQKAPVHTVLVFISLVRVSGYRGAQCSWLVVNENNSSYDGEPTARQALCLCIYLSKRGLLEVQYMYCMGVCSHTHSIYSKHSSTLYSRPQEKLHALYVVLQLLICSDGDCAMLLYTVFVIIENFF